MSCGSQDNDVVRFPTPASVDSPLTSLTTAVRFTRRLLKWCASVGICGQVELPRLISISHEFAAAEELRPISKMALAKALSQLKIPKSLRRIKDHERGIISKRKRDAKRPRVTVYLLTIPEVNDAQLDLFD